METYAWIELTVAPLDVSRPMRRISVRVDQISVVADTLADTARDSKSEILAGGAWHQVRESREEVLKLIEQAGQ